MTGANTNALLHHGPWCKNMNFGRKKVCQESKHATASSTNAEKRVNNKHADGLFDMWEGQCGRTRNTPLHERDAIFLKLIHRLKCKLTF